MPVIRPMSRKKLRAADHLVEPRIGRAQSLQIGENGFAASLAALVQCVGGVESWEFRHQLTAEFGIQKPIDDQMPEGSAGGKLAV